MAIDFAKEALGEYPALFERYWLAGMRKKLGLQTEEADDSKLVQSLLDWMQTNRADFTNTFRDLSSPEALAGGPYQSPDFLAWYSRWQLRLGREGQQGTLAHALMQTVNPAFIPRNHRVEEALSAAEERHDLSVLHRLLAALMSPYQDQAAAIPYREPPPDDSNYRTFCGT